jgi:hypothetical protein
MKKNAHELHELTRIIKGEEVMQASPGDDEKDFCHRGHRAHREQTLHPSPIFIGATHDV